MSPRGVWSAGGPVRLQFTHFSHLGLPVRGERRSHRFHPAYPGCDLATARACPDGTVIIGNAAGSGLALHPAQHIEPPPAFLQAGFEAPRPADMRMLTGRMEADGITIVERNDEAGYAAVKCPGPDGHRIEVHREPPFSRKCGTRTASDGPL